MPTPTPVPLRHLIGAFFFVVACLSLALPEKAASASDFFAATLPKTGTEPFDLPYRYLLPAGYDAANSYPLIVFLHGSGERGNDNNAPLNYNANGALQLVSTTNQVSYPCFMLVPQANMNDGWNGNTLGQVIRAIQVLATTYSIDPNRIYVTGLSMGGGGSWSIITSNPFIFAAAVPMAGWGAGSYERIVGVPIWNFHAANDGTVDVSGSDNAVSALRQVGGRVIYTRYATGGHGIWSTAYATPALLPWMMAQRRNQPLAGTPLITIVSPTPHIALPPIASTLTLDGSTSIPGGVTKVNWTFTPWTGSAGVDTSSYALASGTDSWSVANAPVAADSTLFLAVATGSSWSSSYGGVTTLNDYLWTIPTGANLTAPTISISTPSNTGSVTTTAPTLTLGGIASAASGKTIKAVTWSSDRGGEGVVLGTTSWNVSGIDLKTGDNVITVTARDSSSITATTTLLVHASVGGDIIAPTVPTNLAGTATSSSAIHLTWSASTDNVAVTGYAVYRNDTLAGNSAATSYSDTGLSAGTTYAYSVSAYDAANNFSAKSAPVNATAQPASSSSSSSSGSSSSSSSSSSSGSGGGGGGALPAWYFTFVAALLVVRSGRNRRYRMRIRSF